MRARLLVCACFVLACQDDVVASDDELGADASSSAGSETGETGESGESGTGESDTATGDESETGEPGPMCGDGKLDPDEECDDGNLVDGDGCSSTCESACGVDFWIGMAVDDGWFDVQSMQPHPLDGIELVGGVSGDGFVGTLRYLRVVGTSIDLQREGPALGSAGTAELPQTHAITAARLGADGEILALGASTEVLVMGEAPVARYWLGRFAGADLAEQWRVEMPTASVDERPLDLALLADGDALITSTLRLADNDDDLLLARRSFVDGSEQWSEHYSGKFDNGWSFDRAGRVVVGPGDQVTLAGILRVDWETNETTLFTIDAADGTALDSVVPLADPGNQHEQEIWDLATAGDGRVAVAIAIAGPASAYATFGVFVLEDGEVLWSLGKADIPWDEGGPYVHPKLAFDAQGNLLVSGTYTHSFYTATAPRTFVMAFAPDGAVLCSARVGEGQQAALVPRNGFFSDGLGALNLDTFGQGGMGPMSGGNWLAGLRGW